jgi:hypothetical protein
LTSGANSARRPLNLAEPLERGLLFEMFGHLRFAEEIS